MDDLSHLDASSGHTPEDARYLARLDALLPSALEGFVDPSEVGSLWYGGVLVWLSVPNVPDGEVPVINNTLQVLYNAGSLRAYWGCSHLWDDYDERDPEHLNRDTGDSPPEAVADMAATASGGSCDGRWSGGSGIAGHSPQPCLG